jgi:ligand-binding sensor domain-containing protein
MLPWVFTLIATASQPAAQPPAPAASQYIARTWGTADGLPQNTVDGHAFSVFDTSNTPGLASARITALLEDSQRVLWIGTEAGLTKLEPGRFHSYTKTDGLPVGAVMAVRVDQDRRACTEGIVTTDRNR